MKGWLKKAEAAVTSYPPTRGIALILGLGLLLYGVWLGLPLDSFANPAYALMADIATKPVWAALFGFAGTALMYGVARAHEEWIQRGAWLGFILWGVVAVLGAISAPLTPIHIVRGTIALMHAWVYIQAKVHPYLINGYVNVKDMTEWVRERKIREETQ